jgi:hypothetical protein
LGLDSEYRGQFVSIVSGCWLDVVSWAAWGVERMRHRQLG